MTSIGKGGNLAIEVPAVRAVLSWSSRPGGPDADASALLLGGSGRVGGDEDFVFYNQPQHPSGCVAHLGKQPLADGRGVADAVHVDLAGLPATVERVALAASTADGTFGQLADLRLDIVDAASNSPLAQFVLDAGDETALVTGELYRRDGRWKFRAVGQGYASGLAGLARDFGISVDDDAPAPEPPSAAPPT
ncbi:TerD family protein, partial [Jatrophihabitans endophyticus]|uniref:TerD family protein n=1 Tax=Jatrophihabitans endophyticus TaxID=1206085 RepID=UPI0019FA1E40